MLVTLLAGLKILPAILVTVELAAAMKLKLVVAM
jgi:hypothetical protein